MPLTPRLLDQLAEGGEFLEFSYETVDNLQIENAKLDKCVFRGVGLKVAHFIGGDVQFCEFHGSYLRFTKFERVDLTGTSFVGCNLRHAKFDGSKLWYVDFRECQLDYEAVLQHAPAELYLKERLLHRLRMNANSTGETRIVDRLLLIQMEAERKEQFNVFAVATEYHRRFRPVQRLQSFTRWLTHWFELLVWGYGVRMLSLIRTAVILVLLSALAVWTSRTPYFAPVGESPRALDLGESLYVAVVTFSTLGFGDFSPAATTGRIISVTLSVSGAVFLGLVAATAYRRIQR